MQAIVLAGGLLLVATFVVRVVEEVMEALNDCIVHAARRTGETFGFVWHDTRKNAEGLKKRMPLP